MTVITKRLSKGAKQATIEQTKADDYWLYSVWHLKKGFIASGWRKTEVAAIQAAKLVLNAKDYSQ